MKDKQNFI